MALPNQLRESMLPTELEFIALDELVEIKPTIRMDKLKLISGLYGPFAGGRSTNVPLWLAVNLKLKKKCNIVPPDWLSVEPLQQRLTEETNEGMKSEFVRFPFRYAEIAKVLLDVASDDLEQPENIRKLLKDIRETRQSKIRDTLLNLNPTALQMTGITGMEINEVRPFFSKAMGILIHLKSDNTNATQNMQEVDDDYA